MKRGKGFFQGHRADSCQIEVAGFKHVSLAPELGTISTIAHEALSTRQEDSEGQRHEKLS